MTFFRHFGAFRPSQVQISAYSFALARDNLGQNTMRHPPSPYQCCEMMHSHVSNASQYASGQKKQHWQGGWGVSHQFCPRLSDFFGKICRGSLSVCCPKKNKLITHLAGNCFTTSLNHILVSIITIVQKDYLDGFLFDIFWDTYRHTDSQTETGRILQQYL